MKSKFAVLIIVLIAAVVWGAYLVSRRPAPPKPGPEKARFNIYLVAVEGEQFKLRPVGIEVSPGEYGPETAIRSLLRQGDSPKLTNIIPNGTRLISFGVKGGLATVNLSREFRDNFSGGSETEALMVGALLRTLGQFHGIEWVQLHIEGKPIDTLGHLDLSAPLDVHWVGTEYDGSGSE
ncbi:MAG: GerMN domain-containing protein [Armatimonadota bacterium]